MSSQSCRGCWMWRLKTDIESRDSSFLPSWSCHHHIVMVNRQRSHFLFTLSFDILWKQRVNDIIFIYRRMNEVQEERKLKWKTTVHCNAFHVTHTNNVTISSLLLYYRHHLTNNKRLNIAYHVIVYNGWWGNVKLESTSAVCYHSWHVRHTFIIISQKIISSLPPSPQSDEDQCNCH